MNRAVLILDEQQNRTGMKNCLSSGVDDTVHNIIRIRQLEQAYREAKKLVVLDGSRSGKALGILQSAGYGIVGTVPGNKQYFSVFKGDDSKIVYKFRRLLQVAGYTEIEMQKSLAYICFLQHVVSVGGSQQKLSIDLIRKFSSSMAFENYINILLKNHLISQSEQMAFLSKYSEVSSIAIDLEATLLNLDCIMRFGCKEKISLSQVSGGEALYFHLGSYRDTMLRKELLSMILFDLDEAGTGEAAVYVLADGVREDQIITDFLEELPREVPCIFETSDIFAIEQTSWERMLDRFDICVFSRHASMHSCELCEQQFGMMEVYKNNYTVDYDRHWHSFHFLDHILGNDKVEHYGKTPAWEPVHRKEDIYAMMPGTAVMVFDGSSQLVQCNN